MKTVTARKARLFAVAWALGTAAAYTIAGLLFHFPGAFPPNNGEAFNPDGVMGAVINGLPTGILVGVSQKFLTGMIGGTTWRWAVGTAIALLLIHTVCDVFPDSLALPLITVLGGLLIGSVQWWAVRWPSKYGLPWLAVSSVSWSVGIWLSLLLAEGTDWRTEHIITGLCSGLIIGVATAVAWLWILSDHSSLEERTDKVKSS